MSKEPIDSDAQEKSVTSTHPHKNITDDKSIDFESINEVLIKVFHHDGFRTELQRDAIVQACQFNRDLFVSLPTGSGKSLIYQLPAVYKNHGLTIVVSPLVALISNQISNAKKLGIPCATINSHMTKTWNSQVKSEIAKKDTKLRLLYITPETLCSDHFQSHLGTLIRNKTLKMFAIDEAHCVSSWGHEFRPDYLKLGQLRTRYPLIPIVALTATATSKVLKDILEVLNLKDPKHVIASSFRKNLFYDVEPVEQLDGTLLNDLASFIIDCLKIKNEIERKKKKAEAAKQPKGSVYSQFVSAATLFSTEQLLAPRVSSIAISKKSSKKKKDINKILAKESSKITTFFKPKPIEVINLCDDDDDDSNNDVVIVNGGEQTNGKVKNTQTNKLPISEPSKDIIKAAGVGIVYCRTKLTCEDVAAHLNKKGIPSKPYHSGLTSKERAEIEKLWMDEEVLVICATISFGMGIDKPNVRVVIHYNMSQSLANYYQESGRAGRDGKKAYCRLYYSQSDQSAITFLLRKDIELENSEKSVEKFGSEACKRKQKTARAAMERFEKMVEYCKMSNKCRHLVLAKEFALLNESSFLFNGCGKSCDHCFRQKAWKH